MPTDKTSNQVHKAPNPTGKGGFQERPQDRNPGHWKSEDSISFQYNKLIRLPFAELASYEPETVAQKIALQRIKAAITGEGLNDTKEITDRTEGKALQVTDVTSGGEKLESGFAEAVERIYGQSHAPNDTESV